MASGGRLGKLGEVSAKDLKKGSLVNVEVPSARGSSRTREGVERYASR